MRPPLEISWIRRRHSSSRALRAPRRQIRPGLDDAISMAAEQSISGLEFEPLRRREFEPSGDQMQTRHLLEEMPARKNVLDAGRKYRIAHPIELHFAQALSADRAGAEILPGVLARRLGLLDQVVDQLIDRPRG